METFCVLKVSFIYLHPITMDTKCKILEKAGELFLKFGFKSVTMDEIADKLGISKKTIYTHFKNKTVLVEATTMSFFDMIVHGIDGICEIGKNPIDELFAIKNYTHENLKDESCSSHYQLQKYYPSIFQSLKIRQLELMKTCVKDNLDRGIEQGLYRSTIDVNFISRIYFTGVVGIKDEEIFSSQEFSYAYLSNAYLEYHIRAIATEKGKQTLEKLLMKNEN